MELVIYNAFRKAGVDDAQAMAIAAELNTNFNATIDKAIEQHYAVHSKELATRGDVERVRVDIEQLRLETKVEIEKVRAEVARVEATIIKWIFGAIIAAAGLASGIAVAIARLLFTAT